MGTSTHNKSGHGGDHVSPPTNGGRVGSNIRNLPNRGRKSAHSEQVASNAAPAELHVLPTTRTKKQAADAGESVAQALVEDSDPGALLAEVRDVLFGPTRKLQEARLEELVAILEGLDRENQVVHQGIAHQIKDLESVDQRHELAMMAAVQQTESLAGQHERDVAEIFKRFETLSEFISQEMLRSAEIYKRELDEQTDLYSLKLERQSAQLFEKLTDMADQHTITTQAVASDFAVQLRDLSVAAKTNDDKILAHVNLRMTQSESIADDEKRRTIRVMAEGLNSLSERLQAL